MICIPIVASTQVEALLSIHRANAEPADLLEIRLDYIRGAMDVGALLAAAEKPCIMTCRRASDGGLFQGEEARRRALLEEGARLGAAYVDVEADVLPFFRPQGRARVIASYHNLSETPPDLQRRVSDMETLPCDVVKFATTARSLKDNLRVWEALATCRKKAIGLAMGELGEVSRVLALRQGSLLTFGALEKGRESAPGQLTARDLAELYRAKSITKKTALFGVVGNPIAHSISPEIHNAAFRALGLDAAYLRFRVEDLAEFLSDFECLKLRGLSVTIPHKAAALRAAAEVEPLARRIGAVNTLTRTPRGWAGANTDLSAALGAIEAAAARAGISLKGARALLLGAGGTARALACGLKESGARLTLANRTRAKAEALAREFGGEVMDLAHAAQGAFDIVANATSLGMRPREGETPVDRALFHRGMVAFDAVYNPPETRFLCEARAAGAEVADGLAMFVGQAVRQFETWTGKPAPREVMEQIVRERLSR
ncbi:MAG: shikimate dehydrogenase [Planctomycetota bacterium]